MIKLIPIENKNELAELCNYYQISYNENIHAYQSADEALKAQCVFSLEAYRIELLAVDFESDDPLIPELLIRAVGAYAANRSGYLFHVNKAVGEKIDGTLLRMHFEKDENGYNGKVPKVLEGNCRHKDINNEK